VVLTGARQVGKTTLAQSQYPGLRYLSLDAAEDRETVASLRTQAWAETIGPAVIDEAQKEPVLFEKVKHAFDQGGITFSVLLGSAQIALLHKISESLAGRALVFELWPLTLAELAATPGRPPTPGLLAQLQQDDRATLRTLLADAPELLPSADEHDRLRAFDHLASWGGMPALLRLPDERRRDWLRSYARTYLERDLGDLARLHDLQPFRTFQRLSALRCAHLLSFAELGRDASFSAKTARNYLEYLRISYQAFLLHPYFENLTSSTIKTPKLYWTDVGLLRHLTGQLGPLNGPQFENLVVAEVVKDLRTSGSTMLPWFYATRSGLEVDLLLQSGDQFLGLEIRNREHADMADTRALRALAQALGPRWRGGMVVHRGRALVRLDADLDLWAVPLHRLL
jgi:predicted AAA+ superfamily ATPase